MKLPEFKYHPNPIATGNIKKSDKKCECCGKHTGYIYENILFYEGFDEDVAADDSELTGHYDAELEAVCPWCIANGEIFKKFNEVSPLSDDEPLIQAGLNDQIIKEVTQRTPGYNSWQGDIWQAHCDDACEFHGDATKEEIISLNGQDLSNFLEKYNMPLEVWEDLIKIYEPGNSPSIYKFVCRHCGQTIYILDYA